MATAQDLMTPAPVSIRADDTVFDAAVRMAEQDVGALPILGEGDVVRGMITDRDIVVKVLAVGGDPRTIRTGELASGTPITVQADTDVAYVLRSMVDNQVRRLPVLEGQRLVGIVAQADVARVVDDPATGLLLEALSTPSVRKDPAVPA
ncbi:MAG TPA: CBS domain-containing protein [Pseudonocardia sp.]|jgi:CBS domain-containing protein|uniref:CBS domain-containing protein n=1 Tax=Pseudonocardia sp. TaxID=60912 RepID=UPI002F3F430F